MSLRLPDELLEERKLSEEEKRRRAEARQLAAASKAQVGRVMVLSLPCATGYEITQHFDVVTAEVVLGTGFMSEWDAAFADFFGDRSALMEEKLNAAKQAAMWKMKERDLLLDADALLSGPPLPRRWPSRPRRCSDRGALAATAGGLFALRLLQQGGTGGQQLRQAQMKRERSFDHSLFCFRGRDSCQLPERTICDEENAHRLRRAIG